MSDDRAFAYPDTELSRKQRMKLSSFYIIFLTIMLDGVSKSYTFSQISVVLKFIPTFGDEWLF
jgi:hypothetical protein